jgi:hypothetical protein
VLSNLWATNKAEHVEIIGQYLRTEMQKPCYPFNESIALWQQNGLQEHFLFCPWGNRCHHAHILPNPTRRFWFSTQRIREMILERSELRKRSNNLNTFDTDSDPNLDIDDIVAANERLQQAFTEIDAIAITEQLSSEEILRRYQEVQLEEISRRAVAQREASLRAGEATAFVNAYENIRW